jgi:putative salt-induced outer membrane protein YdiY
LTDVNHYKKPPSLLRISLCVAAFCALRLAADVVETTNGARIVGKITKIHGGVVTLDTDYAGEINVKQTLVTSITTDHPIAVRVANGTRIIGMVSPSPAGGLKIASPTGSIETPVAKIVALWSAGEEDPDVVALRRKWSYQAAVDINGRTGTHTQISTGYMYRAKLTGPNDTFQYYTNYIRQKTDSQVSADQFKAGVDYADNFTPLTSWYVREEGGFNRVNQITFYDVAATGYGYDFIKEKDQVLTGRAGLSYRYDRYSTPDTPSLSSAGGDFELEYSRKIGKAQLHDRLAFVPTFQDLGNYIINHEFSYEIPITKSLWKLSIGMTNNYNSRPVPKVDELETLYFTRLVLTWGQTTNQH